MPSSVPNGPSAGGGGGGGIINKKNSRLGMYSVKRPYEIEEIKLPTVMYEMNPIQSISNGSVSDSRTDLLSANVSR
jgi:hypothetical protein